MASRNWRMLNAMAQASGLHVCAGIDLKLSKLPPGLQSPEGQLTYGCEIIDAVKDSVGYIKPNIAFYEGEDAETATDPNPFEVIAGLVAHANKVAPRLVVILDAKRGDIDATNDGYVDMLDRTGADALTINPYMGRIKGLQPFLDRDDKGCIVLCRTSNAGGAETQDVPCYPLFDPDTKQFFASERHYEIEVGHPPEVLMNHMGPMPYYMFIARRVVSAWNANGNCAMVAGATAPEEMAKIREVAGDMTLLIPGIGKQGGDLKSAVLSGITSDGQGIIVNNSSALTFASDGPDYAEAAANVAEGMHNEITEIIAASRAA